MASTKFASPIVVATVKLDAEECKVCGAIYALSQDFIAARRKDGKTWCCPNGHNWHFLQGESETDRLKRELTQANERIESERTWARLQEQALSDERRSHAATKGKLTKTRNRVQNGVCPDCNRTFQDLARHMHSKHPLAVTGEEKG